MGVDCDSSSAAEARGAFGSAGDSAGDSAAAQRRGECITGKATAWEAGAEWHTSEVDAWREEKVVAEEEVRAGGVESEREEEEA